MHLTAGKKRIYDCNEANVTRFIVYVYIDVPPPEKLSEGIAGIRNNAKA